MCSYFSSRHWPHRIVKAWRNPAGPLQAGYPIRAFSRGYLEAVLGLHGAEMQVCMSKAHTSLKAQRR